MAKARKCHVCQNLGLFPFCDMCFRSSDRVIQMTADKQTRKEKSENQLTLLEERHWKDIARFKYLQNCKDLKNMLKSYLRSRKLMVGSVELNAIITRIISEIVNEIHDEIDLEELVTFADVTNRFDELLGEKESPVEINETDPEYLHGDKIITQESSDGTISN